MSDVAAPEEIVIEKLPENIGGKLLEWREKVGKNRFSPHFWGQNPAGGPLFGVREKKGPVVTILILANYSVIFAL